MNAWDTSRYIRLRVELVLEVVEPDELRGAALDRVEEDPLMPDEERGHAREVIERDEAEALAYLVDPVDLLVEVTGVEVAQASWTSEWIDYDPEAEDWERELDDELEDELGGELADEVDDEVEDEQ